mgnify:CR=1 FL=1
MFRAGINFRPGRRHRHGQDGRGGRRTWSPTISRSPKKASLRRSRHSSSCPARWGLLPGPDGLPRPIRTDYDEESEAARDDVRLFGVFLDDYHVRDGNSLAARQQIARFIETQLGPSDMVGLMYPLQPAAAVRFSRNHAAIKKGIEGFLGANSTTSLGTTTSNSTRITPPRSWSAIRNQVSMSALQALISRMGGLKEGRKALVLVSEGYSNILPPQMRDANSQLPGFGNPAAGTR